MPVHYNPELMRWINADDLRRPLIGRESIAYIIDEYYKPSTHNTQLTCSTEELCEFLEQSTLRE